MNASPDQENEDSASGDAGSLVYTKWFLTSLQGESPLPQTAITLEFTNSEVVEGFGGCTNYWGIYSHEKDSNAIQFGDMDGNVKVCAGQIKWQQTHYQWNVLKAATAYELSGKMLTLVDAEGKTLAEFRAVTSNLPQSGWEATRYHSGKEGVVPVISGTAIEIKFNLDRTWMGLFSCIFYDGFYSINDEAFSIETLEERGPNERCKEDISYEDFPPEDKALADQEHAFVAALKSAVLCKVGDDEMNMYAEDGTLVANFSRRL